MKVIIATLLLISAAEAIRNLVGLPEERSSRLHELLKGKYDLFMKLKDEGSSQLIFQLKQLERRKIRKKKSGLQRASNP